MPRSPTVYVDISGNLVPSFENYNETQIIKKSDHNRHIVYLLQSSNRIAMKNCETIGYDKDYLINHRNKFLLHFLEGDHDG